MAIRVGRFTTTIDIERATETRSSIGEVVQSWNRIATVYGDVSTPTASERYSANRELSLDTKTVTIRYLSDLTQKDRLSIDGKKYDILSISDISRIRQAFLQLLIACKE